MTTDEVIRQVEDNICQKIGGYSIEKDLKGANWVVVKAGRQPEEDYIFNKRLRQSKVSRKLVIKAYQSAHSKWGVQTNLGRVLECERECYLEQPFSRKWKFGRLSSDYLIYAGYISEVWRQTLSKTKTEAMDPHQEFTPSYKLVKLIIPYMVTPDEKISELQKKAKMIYPDSSNNNMDLKLRNIISEEVEGQFTDLAKRAFITKEQIEISRDNRFSPEICSELIERLELDAYNPRPVLDLLYTELLTFASVPRERSWGKIIVENSELKLVLKENAFSLFDLDNINSNRWVITK